MALTSFASESSSSSATKKSCIGHSPDENPQGFEEFIGPTLEQLCDTTPTHHLGDHVLIWVETLLWYAEKLFLFKLITTICEKQLMGNFWSAQAIDNYSLW